MADNGKWIVMVLKDRFSNDVERESLKNGMMMRFSLKSNDIYYIPLDDNRTFGNFLFVRERDPENDLRNFLEFRREMFEAYPMHMRISDDEFTSMVDGIVDKKKSAYVKHGDIVVIKKGRYSKLFGIVLRENRSGKIIVGLKFCFGTVTEEYNQDELKVIGNIFNYLKVLK